MQEMQTEDPEAGARAVQERPGQGLQVAQEMMKRSRKRVSTPLSRGGLPDCCEKIGSSSRCSTCCGTWPHSVGGIRRQSFADRAIGYAEPKLQTKLTCTTFSQGTRTVTAAAQGDRLFRVQPTCGRRGGATPPTRCHKVHDRVAGTWTTTRVVHPALLLVRFISGPPPT